MTGLVALWSGAIVDIQDGWILCDGNNGSPDLRNKFIVGAGDAYAIDDEGGSVNHNHTFTANGHNHEGFMPPPSVLRSFSPNTKQFTFEPIVGTTDNETNIPKYYALSFIMFVGQ